MGNIGEKIKILRKKRGYSQQQIALKLHLTQGAVSQWENGVTQPAADQIAALATVFGITSDELLGRENKANAEDDTFLALREQYRRDPNTRILFDAAKGASPEHLRAAAAMLKALEPDQEGYYPDE